MDLTPNMEDYLEAIYEIDRTKHTVRVKDVSMRLGVTMPSVNNALKNLTAKGLVNHNRYEYIELTENGVVEASRISSRHRVLLAFLRDIIGVDETTAETEACSLEHILSPETIRKITTYIENNSET